MKALRFSDDGLFPVHVVAEFSYCPRSAYFLLTGAESAAVGTAEFREGAIEHGKVDAGGRRSLRGEKAIRRLRVSARRLGVKGVIDQVKIGAGGEAEIWEYKRGKSRPNRVHELQVALLAICFAETTLRTPKIGVVWTTGDRRARRFELSAELLTEAERLTRDFATAAWSTGLAAWPRRRQAGCRACVFRFLCWPEDVPDRPMTCHDLSRRPEDNLLA